MKLGERAKSNVDVIPSGSMAIDRALGIGGYPKGRIIEIFGPESSGKTTVALHAIAEAQKKGGKAAFIDAEHAIDPGYAKNLGVNVDELILSFKTYIKDKLSNLFDFIKLNKLESSLCIVITGGIEQVALFLSNESLLFLCEINSSIDFDFI